jgi:hypothetical protein
VSSVRVTIGTEASASSFCGWCSRIQEIGVITSTTEATAISGRFAREPPAPSADRAAREPPRPPPPEAAAEVAVVGPAVAAVVMAVPAVREAAVPVGSVSESASFFEANRRPGRAADSLVEPAADCVTHAGEVGVVPAAAARE